MRNWDVIPNLFVPFGYVFGVPYLWGIETRTCLRLKFQNLSEYHTYEKFLFKREMKKRVFVILTYDVNQKRVGKVCKVCKKLVDCLEKCLIYGHIRRFANWFYYSFTTFNGLSLDMQKAPAGCRIDRYTTLRGTSKRKNKITPPIRRRFSLLHWRTGTLLFYALMLRSKGKWSLDLCGS